MYGQYFQVKLGMYFSHKSLWIFEYCEMMTNSKKSLHEIHKSYDSPVIWMKVDDVSKPYCVILEQEVVIHFASFESSFVGYASAFSTFNISQEGWSSFWSDCRCQAEREPKRKWSATPVFFCRIANALPNPEYVGKIYLIQQR